MILSGDDSRLQAEVTRFFLTITIGFIHESSVKRNKMAQGQSRMRSNVESNNGVNLGFEKSCGKQSIKCAATWMLPNTGGAFHPTGS